MPISLRLMVHSVTRNVHDYFLKHGLNDLPPKSTITDPSSGFRTVIPRPYKKFPAARQTSGMAENSKQSLVKLTHDLIELLIARNGEEVDLKDAGDRLGAAKRRLYDVTNVLAGIGVIERCGKAKVKWVGTCDSASEAHEIAELLARERELTALCSGIDSSLRTLSESEDFRNHGWLSQEDILKLVDGDGMSLFALRGPSDLTIELPDEDLQRKHRLVCTSASGPVDLISIRSGLQ
jgi:transcription factor E2F3